MPLPPQAPVADIERYRAYLELMARLQVGRRLRGKIDLSGVVQQTMLEAHLARERWSSAGEVQLTAWLRRILANNLRDEVRKISAAARDVTRERPLEAEMDESSSRVEAWLAADQSSPSEHVMRQEQLLALAHALAQLPDDQRQAIELHHLQGCPLAEVAQALERNKGAVAALLYRGLKKLRGLLAAAVE